MSQSSANEATASGGPTLRILLDGVLDGSMRKDKTAVLACFAPDALFIDPHYPTPEMRGLREIEAGLDWAFVGMERFGFAVVRFFSSEDGNSGAVEMDCEHVLAGGRVLKFPQVFVAEMKDGRLTRLRAYEPYGPGFPAMQVIRLQNWWINLKRKRSSGSSH